MNNKFKNQIWDVMIITSQILKKYMLKFDKIVFTLIALFSMINLSVGQDDEDGALRNSEMYIQQGNYIMALKFLNQYIELYPTDAEAYIKRARAYEILGQSSKKQEDLQYANYLNPFAYMYISNNKRSSLYEKKKFAYDYGKKNNNFSKSPVKNGYYKMYLKDKEQLHSQDTILEQAIYALSQGDLDKTETLLSEVTLNDNIVGILSDLNGLVELKRGNLTEAIDYFTESINEMPSFSLAYHNRAVAYKLNGEYDKAKEDLMTAVGLNEDISVFFFTLAKLSERLDNPNDAISYYREAIDKDPAYIEARTNFSLLQKSLGYYNEAIVELKEVSKMMKDNANNHFINGGIHFTYGEYEEAIKEFNIFLDENDNDCDAIFNRGLAQVLRGYKKEGCDDIYESIQIKSNPKRVEILESFCPNH